MNLILLLFHHFLVFYIFSYSFLRPFNSSDMISHNLNLSSPNIMMSFLEHIYPIPTFLQRGAIHPNGKRVDYFSLFYNYFLFLFCICWSFRRFINEPVITCYFMVVIRLIYQYIRSVSFYSSNLNPYTLCSKVSYQLDKI